jgi:chaperonin cofactor prefoldin
MSMAGKARRPTTVSRAEFDRLRAALDACQARITQLERRHETDAQRIEALQAALDLLQGKQS